MALVIARSETTTLRFQRKDGDGHIITEQPDDIFFTIKKNARRTDVLVQKRLSTGGIVFNSEDNYYYIELSASDTDRLADGTYAYDIKRKIDDTEKYLVKNAPLIVEASVTLLADEVDDG